MSHQRQIDARRRRVALFTVLLLAVALAAISLARTGMSGAPAPVTGVFTGEITPGGPVYRLPLVHVVADRRSELARLEREEQLERAREVQAKSARTPRS